MEKSPKQILVTGYGPFGKHKINASWEAVQLLPHFWTEEDADLASLTLKQVPVSYQYVLENFDLKNLEVNPDFIINVGVFGKGIGGRPDIMTLESQSHNFGYSRKDIDGQFPENGKCIKGCPDTLSTNLDLPSLKSALEKSELKVSDAIHLSEDAGHYLCDFIYCKSLHMMSGNAVFVHVPELDEKITAEKISFDLAQIIRQICKQ